MCEGNVAKLKGKRVLVISTPYMGIRAMCVRVVPLEPIGRFFETSVNSLRLTGESMTPEDLHALEGAKR